MIPITAFYLALLTLLLITLTVRVIVLRRSQGVALDLGKPSSTALQQAVRAHGNLCEYAPFFVLMLACAELQHTLPAWGLHSVGAVFLVGRVAHATSVVVLERFDDAGKLTATPFVRIVGMICTFTVLLALALVSLYHSISTFI